MLRERIITALVLAALLLSVLFFAPLTVAQPIIAIVMLIGAWEWARFCGWNRWAARSGYVAVIAVALALATYFATTSAVQVAIWSIALVWWLIAFLWVSLAPARVTVWGAALAGVLVLIPTYLALVELFAVPTQAPSYLLFLLVLVASADIGAYFAGRAWGRVKLAPRVSPGKTWEGALGGLTGAGAIAVVGALWFELPMVGFVSLCLAVAILSIVGDLTESMFKRHVNLKDSSGLLPGHGGVLDRIDSVSAAAPVFALGLAWFGALK